MTSRTLSSALLVGLVLALGCGRTAMDTLVRGTGGEPIGAGRAAGGGGGSGGGFATGSGGTTGGTGGSGGVLSSASEPCGQASCLTSLFRNCLPAGSCSAQGGGGPHAFGSGGCYANGVFVSLNSGWDGVDSVRGSLAVRRDGSNCYTIQWVEGPGVTSYVITDGSGHQVADGTRDLGATTITMTCAGGSPTSVSEACLTPFSRDFSNCDSKPCP